MSEQRELKELVARAQSGDLAAYGQIYDRLYDRIYAYVFHQVDSRTNAEDITAGVFVGALEKLDGFTWRGAGFIAWLYRIARNDVLDHFRRRGREAREVALTTEVFNQPADVRVEEIVAAAWGDRELLEAVKLLSEDQQQVIMLRMIGNLSNREIGEVVSKSEGAVKALQHRALENLRRTLGDR